MSAGRPFVQWQAPLAWTTLSLTLYADGHAEGALVGASRFPRHWVYDHEGNLASKSGLIDFNDWYRKSFGRTRHGAIRTPRPSSRPSSPRSSGRSQPR